MRVREATPFPVLLTLVSLAVLAFAVATGGPTASAAMVPTADEVSTGERDAAELALGSVATNGDLCTPDAALVGLGGQTCELGGGSSEPQASCVIYCECVVSHNILECWCIWIC